MEISIPQKERNAAARGSILFTTIKQEKPFGLPKARLVLAAIISRSEDSRADTDVSRAFFDGGQVRVAHAHG